MKIRRFHAAAILATALGTAILTGAAPAVAAPQTGAHVSDEVWVVRYGPYPTLEQCQAQRDLIAQNGDPTTPCTGSPSVGYGFRVYIR
ncbi:hypothetical protein AB0395_10680 [Streptosporangium sp. NPDC051023]|uniref:hypothetical protein n=1 Tax=Streptosporangium sp. NPDC051023 TaxID=3155410 RepID=UPI00344F376E